MKSDDLANLNRHRPVLVRDMDGMRVVDHLVAASIFNDYNAKEIELQKLPDSEDKNRRLLYILKTKGGEAFHQFLVALRATNQHSLATLLDGQYRTEELQQIQNITQKSLKEKYLIKFRHVYPFSLPFTFDIESTWISLTLKEASEDSQATEDHAKLLERAFEKAKLLIIEGDPATGKTSLMRKLAYEWAKGKEELLYYNLVLYAEFREVREREFENIVDLVLWYSKKYLKKEDFERLALQIKNEEYCKMYPILILLDGYDESSLERQCSELSIFLSRKTIDNSLLFNIVLTTRKGYLSNLRGYKGRFVFAEVLGFATEEQKKKYIDNHFSSKDESIEHIVKVHHLLKVNKNLNKLSEVPLFLTLICIVHEEIIDGTLLELYCNSIRWLIDRHQQDFPDRDIPALFEFQSDSEDRFRTIQDHYLEFPQLRCFGKMALNKLKENIFQQSDINQFKLKPVPVSKTKRTVLEYVGLLRKNEFYKSLNLITTFSFPHRTIQEFLAAVYYFASDENTDQRLSKNSDMNTYKPNEYKKFLLRIALSKHMPINEAKQKTYFATITKLTLDLAFDAINTSIGINNELLNWFIAKCKNIQILQFNKFQREAKISVHNHLTFTNLTYLHSLSIFSCTFEINSHISFTDCPSLKTLQFISCDIKSSATIDFSRLPTLGTLQFDKCSIDLKVWQLITDEITRSSVKKLKLSFEKDFSEYLNHLQKCKTVEKIQIEIWEYNVWKDNLFSLNDLSNLHSLMFWFSIFEVSSQISFTNGSFLKTLAFHECDIKCNATIDISKLSTLNILRFSECRINLKAWQLITDEITRSSVKQLHASFEKEINEFLDHLQKCKNVEKTEIRIINHNSSKDNFFLLNDLINLQSLTFGNSTFEVNFKISVTNCPSLKTLKFKFCEIKSSSSIHFSKLPALDSLTFDQCTIDLKAWQSITDEIMRSTVKQLKLIIKKDFDNQFLNYLKKCSNVKRIDIGMDNYNISKDNFFSLNDLINIHPLTFWNSTFEANSQISFTNGPFLKQIEFSGCKIKSSATIGFSKLPALDILEFYECTIDLKAWQLITEEIIRSSVKQLHFSSDFFETEENLELVIHLNKCDGIEKIKIFVFIGISNEEQLTKNFSDLAKNMKGLKSITFDSSVRRMKEENMNMVKKAGQERDPGFKICLIFSSRFFTEREHLGSLVLLQECECIEKIEIYGLSDMYDEEQLITNLSRLAREMKGLKIIAFDDQGKRMAEENMKIIKMAGKERYPNFRTIFGKETEEDYDPHGKDKELKRIDKEETRKGKRKRKLSSSS